MQVRLLIESQVKHKWAEVTDFSKPQQYAFSFARDNTADHLASPKSMAEIDAKVRKVPECPNNYVLIVSFSPIVQTGTCHESPNELPRII